MLYYWRGDAGRRPNLWRWSAAEQIIGILGEQEAGITTAEVCRKHGISQATFYAWKAKFGGMSVSDASRLKVSAVGSPR